MKTVAIILATVIGVISLWSGSVDAHAMHVDPPAAIGVADSGGDTPEHTERCHAGHVCHAQILPAAPAALAHSPASYAAARPLKASLGHAVALVADPPPPRA